MVRRYDVLNWLVLFRCQWDVVTTSQKCRTHWRISSDVVMTSQCGSRRPNLNETKMRRHYDVPCRVGEFLFRQLMLSWTLRSIFDRPPKQWPTGRKRRKDRNTKNWISRERKELFGWNKKQFSLFLKGYHSMKK